MTKINIDYQEIKKSYIGVTRTLRVSKYYNLKKYPLCSFESLRLCGNICILNH